MTLELSVKVQIQFAYFHCTYIYTVKPISSSQHDTECVKKILVTRYHKAVA